MSCCGRRSSSGPGKGGVHRGILLLWLLDRTTHLLPRCALIMGKCEISSGGGSSAVGPSPSLGTVVSLLAAHANPGARPPLASLLISP